MIFPVFFNWSLNFARRNSLSEPQSASGLVLADCMVLLYRSLQRIWSSYFGIDHLVMFLCRVISCVVGRRFWQWQVHSLGKTLLVFALLHFVLQSQACLLLYVSLDLLLLHFSFLWFKGHLYLVLVLERIVSVHRTIQLHLLQH